MMKPDGLTKLQFSIINLLCSKFQQFYFAIAHCLASPHTNCLFSQLTQINVQQQHAVFFRSIATMEETVRLTDSLRDESDR